MTQCSARELLNLLLDHAEKTDEQLRQHRMALRNLIVEHNGRFRVRGFRGVVEVPPSALKSVKHAFAKPQRYGRKPPQPSNR